MINRRKFILLSVASPLILNGCLPLIGLMRLGARGGLIARAARSARFTKRGNLSTFGRASSSALQLYRLSQVARAANSLQTIGDIFEVDSEQSVIDVKSSEKLSECWVDGVPITSTRRDGLYLEHYSNIFQSSVGVSKMTSENTTEHRDNKNRFIGADVHSENVIHHYNSDRDLVGKTPYRLTVKPSSDTIINIDDDSYLRNELNKLTKKFQEQDNKQLNLARKKMLNAQNNCLQLPPNQSCESLSMQAQNALYELEKKFS